MCVFFQQKFNLDYNESNPVTIFPDPPLKGLIWDQKEEWSTSLLYFIILVNLKLYDIIIMTSLLTKRKNC